VKVENPSQEIPQLPQQKHNQDFSRKEGTKQD